MCVSQNVSIFVRLRKALREGRKRRNSSDTQNGVRRQVTFHPTPLTAGGPRSCHVMLHLGYATAELLVIITYIV